MMNEAENAPVNTNVKRWKRLKPFPFRSNRNGALSLCLVAFSRRKPVSVLARRLGTSERGVTLVEFALVFPIMLALFIGMVEFGEAFSVSRKISNAASTIADLVSQENSVTEARLTDIARVANELIKPYRPGPFSLRIVSLVADENNQRVNVAWTYPENAAAIGTEYTGLPSMTMTEANSSLIVAETSYAFTPSVGYFIGSITLNGFAYFRPRTVRSVAKLAP